MACLQGAMCDPESAETERHRGSVRPGRRTFDISILKLHDGIFEVMPPTAIRTSAAMTSTTADHDCLDDIQGDLGLDVRRNGEIVQTIRKAVIETKIALSSQPSAN